MLWHKEAHQLFSLMNVEHSGFGNFGAKGIAFLRCGEYGKGLSEEVTKYFTPEELNGRYHLTYTTVEGFKKIFPKVELEIVNK